MATGKYYSLKTEGGQGGRLGHSNMAHWDGTEIIKEKSKKARRLQDKSIAQKALKEEE